eukprot:m.37614 g.37614  ORF g.37614 m.37614 type:complete len:54 (+) comp14579_c0_seq1:182-343(+)
MFQSRAAGEANNEPSCVNGVFVSVPWNPVAPREVLGTVACASTYLLCACVCNS